MKTLGPSIDSACTDRRAVDGVIVSKAVRIPKDGPTEAKKDRRIDVRIVAKEIQMTNVRT